MNPHFPEIARVVRRLARHSSLDAFTNGLALRGRNLDAIVENFSRLHISLNAVKRETFDGLIKGDYDATMANLEELSRRKPAGFYVELSMVLMKSTAGDARPMIELAARLGFQRVIAAQYVATTNRVDQEQSVKEDQRILDDVRRLRDYAQNNGVDFLLAESARPPKVCALPWMSAYITNDDIGRRIFTICCSGIGMNTYVSPSVYVDFKKAWNSKRMQHIRETVNAPREMQNNMCYLCKQTDKTDRNWNSTLRRLVASTDRQISFNQYGEAVAFPREHI